MVMFSYVYHFLFRESYKSQFWEQYRVCNSKLGGKHSDHCGLKALLTLCNFSDWYDALSAVKSIENCDIKAYTVKTYYSYVSFA
jgi:hypothetical protein